MRRPWLARPVLGGHLSNEGHGHHQGWMIPEALLQQAVGFSELLKKYLDITVKPQLGLPIRSEWSRKAVSIPEVDRVHEVYLDR